MKLTDEHLMQRFQSGDGAALAELESRYNDWLAAYFMKWLSLPNPTDAQDLAADTWLGVIGSKVSFNAARGRFQPWLFGVARNIGNEALAKRYRGGLPWGTGESEDLLVADEDGFPGNDIELTNVEAALISKIAVSEGLEKLFPLEREVLLLFYVHDCTCTEIARIQSCSLAAAKSRLRRARYKIVQYILCEVQVVPKRGAK